jgi:hypothetical protein
MGWCRRYLSLGVVAFLAAGAAGCSRAASQSAVSDSGIDGLVLLAPTCAVQPAGDPCVRPYQATISIRREPAGSLITSVHSSATGRFNVALAPGRYLLVPRSSRVYPRSSLRTVIVRGHRYTRVTVVFDSGIRGAVRLLPGVICANPVGCPRGISSG